MHVFEHSQVVCGTGHVEVVTVELTNRYPVSETTELNIRSLTARA